MNTSLSAVGQNRSWSLLRKLGEGDAGEVYLVESILEGRQAILKRPRRSAFSSEIIRQASQIENEGLVLQALNGLRPILPRKSEFSKVDIRVPELLDRSQAGTEFSDRFFIVVNLAPGLDLNQIAKLARFGAADVNFEPSKLVNFVETTAKNGAIPDLILIRALAGILLMFEAIHNFSPNISTGEKTGIVWNDVKPEHIFWDPERAAITVIDWGNAQFLEADGYNKDRRISKNDDLRQFIQTFGSFLAETGSGLLDELNWPSASTSIVSFSDQVRSIRTKLSGLLKLKLAALHSVRKDEAEILRKAEPDQEALRNLFQIQESIISFGEMPDFSSADRFCNQLAGQLMQSGALAEFTELSRTTCHLHAENPVKWLALTEIAEAASSETPSTQRYFIQAISAGLVDDWASALWLLLTATADQPEPTWWDHLSSLIRQMGLGIDPESIPPLIVLRRNILLMQAAWLKMCDQPGSENPDPSERETQSRAIDSVLKTLKEEIAVRWEETEPAPPDSDLMYSEIERYFGDINAFMPEAMQTLARSLKQPAEQVRIILESWDSMDFDSARRGLRRLLLWDPDRRRVLAADDAIVRAPKWLEKIRSGPQDGQTLVDYATETEFIGRELRNQVGGAGWLNSIIEMLTQLRKGRRPGELLVEQPELTRLLPWLETLEPRRYIPSQSVRPINLEREITARATEIATRGIQESKLGLDQGVLLADPLDTWAPEARGSSARTFNCFVRTPAGQLKQVAIKIMRGDRREYALPLFREEVQILNILGDVPGIIPMLECGFIQLADGISLPPDNRPINARNLNGTIQRFSTEYIPNFLSNLDTWTQQGWLPYIIMPKLDNQENLMWVCDAGYTRGRFIPIEESLRLALQICDILQIAHERNIVYRDHKLLHYYWLELYNGVFMIDWNVARYHPQGLSQSEIQFDLVQLGARALHHIFTGRVAPGALADGPNRVEEIEAASNSYRTQWTYDDQRLPPDLKEILAQLLANNYTRVNRLREDINQLYLKLISEVKLAEMESQERPDTSFSGN